MLAAYPAKALDEETTAITIYGSEDSILNMEKMADAKRYLPAGSKEYVIEGGNHSQFGNYGKQDGDRNVAISSDEQQGRTVELVFQTK